MNELNALASRCGWRAGILGGLAVTAGLAASAQVPRCEVVPLPHDQVSFRIDGVERTRWRFGEDAPWPFFYPFAGPGGGSLTRMGHPGAPNHDHHRSVWFAHHDVAGLDFWSDTKGTRVRQSEWLAYEDGEEEAVMASRLLWRGPQGVALLRQELVAAVRPLESGEWTLELQSTFQPAEGRRETTLGKTNFGLLAVRVARSVSGHFGGGGLRDSEGRTGEKAIFGREAAWMDYSGPVRGTNGAAAVEGVTYFVHPETPGAPLAWHVREDGWMGASHNRHTSTVVRAESPLRVRFLLHAHAGPCDPERAGELMKAFAARSAFVVEKSGRPHRHWQVRRAEEE